MIIVDTNVASEPTKPSPDPGVIAWLDRQPIEELYFTAINLSEFLVGVEIMPDGRRKRERAEEIEHTVRALFGSRILPFDQAAAMAHASVVARTRAAGKSIQIADSQIAAIAQVYGVPVATRDVDPFIAAGIVVINPWENHLQ